MKYSNSLVEQINLSHKRIIRITLIPLFVILYAVLFGACEFYISNTSNLFFKNFKPNLSYWLVVGDRFQIERTIKKFNKLNDNWEMGISYDSLKFPLEFQKNHLSKVFRYKMLMPSKKEAFLTIKTKYPLIEVLIITSLVSGIFLLTFIPIKLSLSKIFNDFKLPLEQFINRLSKVSYFEEVSKKTYDYKFRELNEVSRAVSKMFGRVREGEEKIQRLEKEMIISDVVKQVSHDLISPLTVQKTILENIEEKLEPSDYEMLNLSVERIEGIASQVLESHRSQKSSFNFNCLTTVVNEKKVEKNYEKIQFENNLTNEVKLYVDELKLLSVISNLLNNAIEASSDSKGQVSLSVCIRDGFVCLEVKDEGAGIPDEVLVELGGKGATFGKVGGNGLGLYSAKKFTEENKGHFKITSVFGVGTSVKISFPLNS